MKLLSSEQQEELLEVLNKLKKEINPTILGSELLAQLSYWVIELKPKRVRRKKDVDKPQETVV